MSSNTENLWPIYIAFICLYPCYQLSYMARLVCKDMGQKRRWLDEFETYPGRTVKMKKMPHDYKRFRVSGESSCICQKSLLKSPEEQRDFAIRNLVILFVP